MRGCLRGLGGGSRSLRVGAGNTPRPPSAFTVLGLSLAGGTHGAPGPRLALLHPSPDRQTPPRQTDTRFWELLTMGKKFPALRVTHGGDNWLHRLFFFLLLPKETIVSSARHWDTMAFAISLCFV